MRNYCAVKITDSPLPLLMFKLKLLLAVTAHSVFNAFVTIIFINIGLIGYAGF